MNERRGGKLRFTLACLGFCLAGITAPLRADVWTGSTQGCIPAPADYDGDGNVDFSLKCGPAWHFYNDNGSYIKGIWTGGSNSDVPVPADYDGDGDEDPVAFNGGAWHFYDYATGAYRGVWTGATPGCIPAPADYDGDGDVDLSVKCGPAWHFYNSNGTYLKGIWTGGSASEVPVPGDYNSDGDADVVAFNAGAWQFFDYATGAYIGGVWTGANGTLRPVPMDYDGDGTMDLTVHADGTWHFFDDDGTYLEGIWTGGVATDIPAPRDFNGDGPEESVIFRNGAWLFFSLGDKTRNTQVPQQCPSSWREPQPLPAITLAETNKQYFSYKNQIIPLIGLSSEYVCHITQPGEYFDKCGVKHVPNRENCTWENHHKFIDLLKEKGLNVMRLWVGLNHSLGLSRDGRNPRLNGRAFAYPNEQPFKCKIKNRKCTGVWDVGTLDPSDDPYDPVYWERLKCVIGYAGSKGVIVELTLFDSEGGDWMTGPWHRSRNSQNIGFTEEKYFSRFVNDLQRIDPPGSQSGSQNADARKRQMALVRKAVAELNAYPNLIWELANEADLKPAEEAAAAAHWMNRVAAELISAERQRGHLIEVELHRKSVIAELLKQNENPSLATASVVTAHYVEVGEEMGDYGGIELIRAKHAEPDFKTRAFGFNEGRSTPLPSNPDSVRAEAWEFAFNEGGLYNHYNLHFLESIDAGEVKVQVETEEVSSQLGKLKSFLLAGLGMMRRDACEPDCWLTGTGLARYGMDLPICTRPNEPDWKGKKYRATMHSPSRYVAYIHHSHSTLGDPVPRGCDSVPQGANQFSRYEPPPAGCATFKEINLRFKPDIAGLYSASWLKPVDGSLHLGSPKAIGNGECLAAGTEYAVPNSPTYDYDIVLRITRTGDCSP